MKIVNTALFLGALLLFAGARETCAQIADSETSARWIAGLIVSDAGGTEDQYLNYSRSLAKTIGLLSTNKQTRVFGFTPPSGDGGTTGEGTTGPSTNYANPSEAIDDPDMESLDLLLYLLNQFPLSNSDLTGALERDPPMEGDHLQDLLLIHSPVSNGFLVSSLSNSKDNLTSTNLKEIIIANSPVEAVVLKKVNTTTKMSAADKAAVMAAQ